MESAELVLIVGSNTAESHPVLASKLKAAHKKRGQKMYVVDIRRHEMAERADFFMQPKPGTDLIWATAITRYILEQGLANQEFLDTRVNGLPEFKQCLISFTLEYAAEACGVTIDELKHLAHAVAGAKTVCLLWAMGITQHTMGSDSSTAFCNLLLVTGNFMRKGTGAYPLRGHNNVQGTGDHGASPKKFPGYQPVSDDKIRAKFAQAWGVPLSTNKGLDNHEMIDAIHEGKLKGMYVYGEEINLVESNIHHVEKALEKLEFFVVQDIFFNKTARLADVVLPACHEPREGRHLHEHGTARAADLPGLRAPRRIAPGLANHPGRGEPARRRLELRPSFGDLRRDRLALPPVRRDQLRTARGV